MKIGKVIYKIISTIVLVIMIVLAVLLIGMRLLGFTPYTVLSPSMTPKYPVGSSIYVKEIDPQDIEVGDDITFVLDESLTVVTHQVVEIDENHEFFTTKGIANNSNDGAPVYYENILGTACFCIPWLGYIADRVTSPIGLIISIAVVIMWCIVIYMIGLSKEDDEETDSKGKVKSKRSCKTEQKPKRTQGQASRKERINKGYERSMKRREK